MINSQKQETLNDMIFLKNISAGFLFLFLFENSIYSQEISGLVVSAADGEPAIGVSVAVKGTNKGAVTDMNGKYHIKIDSLCKTLTFNYLGYYTQNIDIAGNTTINVSLEEEPLLFEKIIFTEFIRKSIHAGDILRIITTENKLKTDTIRFGLTSYSNDLKLTEDSVMVSNIIANKRAVDSLGKYYIIDYFSTDCVIKSLWDYLFKEIQYPKVAKEQGISGTILAEFTIDTAGNIKDIKILRNIEFLGDEVFNALKAMPKWLQTGIRDTQIMYGKTVEKKYILPILFRIEEIK